MTPAADPGTVTKRLTPLRPTNPVAADADAPARPVWAAALLSFVPGGLRDRADPWLTRLPVIAILVLQAVLTLRLHNVVFNDEGLYINAGHEYLREFSGGAAAPDSYGGYFSGFPMAYPVFAALLDSVGGVGLVRLSSLLLMSVATLAVGHIGRRLAPAGQENRVRLVAMLAFVLTGAVLFVGNLATYDAACMSLLAVSTALMMSGRGYRSAFAAGILIAAAGICKYSAAVFLPVVAVLGVLAPLPPRRALLRACLFFVYGLLGMLAVLVPFASFIIPGIAFTTSDRVALNPRPMSLLLAEFGRGAGLLTAIAAAAVIVLLHRWWTRRDRPSLQVAATALVLAAAGLGIPLGQFRMHEYVSFNKHLAFLAIFLAPIAAQLVTVTGRVVKGVAFTTAVYLLAVGALFRSSFMFTEWPDTTPVSEAVAHYGRPGTYLAYAGNTMAFYAKDRPDMTFEEYYALFGAGKPAIKAAIDQGTYVGVTFVTGSTGDADLDENTAYLISLLNDSTRYEPVGSWPKHEYDANRFYLYLRTS